MTFRFKNLLAVAALSLVASCAASGSDSAADPQSSSPSPSPTPTEEAGPSLDQAYVDCSTSKGGKTISSGDDGDTLIIDTGSEYGSIEGAVCVFTSLETPEAIIASIESTTAMMGVQDADDQGLRYQWSYHPDNGLNVIITNSDG